MAPAPCLGQAVMLQALGTLSGLLTSPEAASAAILTLPQYKGVTCLAKIIRNHFLLRNSTSQVTLQAIRRVFFLPWLLSAHYRAPGQGCRASPHVVGPSLHHL